MGGPSSPLQEVVSQDSLPVISNGDRVWMGPEDMVTVVHNASIFIEITSLGQRRHGCISAISYRWPDKHVAIQKVCAHIPDCEWTVYCKPSGAAWAGVRT